MLIFEAIILLLANLIKTVFNKWLQNDDGIPVSFIDNSIAYVYALLSRVR